MNSLENDVSKCIGNIYNAALNSRQWQSVLEILQSSLKASAVAWLDYDFERESGWIFHSVGQDPGYIRRYATEYVGLNPWMKQESFYEEGQISIGQEILSDEELVKTRFYKEWLAPQQFFHRICAVARREDSKVFYLEAYRPSQSDMFAEPEINFLTTILPHLMQSMKLNRNLWQMAVINEVLERQLYALIAVNNKGRVLFKNVIAKEILDQDSSLNCVNGQLHVANSNLDAKLKALIEGATSHSVGLDSKPGGMLVIPGRNGKRLPLWLIVSPLKRQLRHVIGQENQVALVYLSTQDRECELPKGVVKTLFGLTNAEERLLHLILQGCKLNEASKILHISQNTARTHMKHIYAKTGADCQVSLVRLFLNWNTVFNQHKEATT